MKKLLLACVIFVKAFSPAFAEETEQTTLDMLFDNLHNATEEDWKEHQQAIWDHWSNSGSPTADMLLQRGRVAIQTGRHEQAIDHFNDLIALYPNFAEGWNARATAYFVMEEYGQSIKDIEHTLSLEPRHFGAYSGLGVILERIDQKEEAMRAYRKAIELNPHLPGAKIAIERLSDEVDGQEL